jgi:hypothetical protein
MNKLLLTGLAISWRVDYDEKGVAKGRHVAISADAREVALFGRRLGTNVMISETMLEQVKVNETLFNSWIDAVSKHIVKGLGLKGAQLCLEVNTTDVFISLREQLSIGMKQFCENDMPWYHTFYIIKTIKPGETFIDDTHINLEDLESTCEGFINNSDEPKVVVIKVD